MNTKLLSLLFLAALLAVCGEKSSQAPPATASSPTVLSSPPIVSSVEITLTRDERILLGGRVVPLDKLAATLGAAGVPPATIGVRADFKVSFSFVARVLEALRSLSPPILLAS